MFRPISVRRRDFLRQAAWLAAPLAVHPALAAVPKTKITKVEALQANRYTYVKVHTDAGVHGVGEMHPASSTSGGPVAAVTAVESFAEYLRGKDPTEIERHWQHMFHRNIFRGGADSMAAIGAIDIALWDIAGKLAGLPVYKLLGGPTRERVWLYPHMGGKTPELMAEAAQQKVAEGYTSVRCYPLGDFGSSEVFNQGPEGIARTAERFIAAIRKAVGPEIEILIDVVCRLTPQEALAMGRALQPYHLYFFEDPIPPDNIDAMADLARAMPMPLAFGERLSTIHQFNDVLNKKAAMFLRPDLSLAGGITNCKKIATLAEPHYVGVVPHNPLSCVLTAACAQVCASAHNIPIQEYPPGEWEKPKRDLVKEPLKVEKGYLIIPDKPGIGVELNEEAFKHYPPSRGTRPAIVNRDGSVREY
jgi:galactonate dehydratase